MYICLCHGITDKQIRQAMDRGQRSLGQIRQVLGVASQCGKCAKAAGEVIRQHGGKDVQHWPEQRDAA